MTATMTYEECMLAVLASPEDDAPRRELANVLRATDPAWAKFIDLQLDHTARNRARRIDSTLHDGDLLARHQQKWTRDLRFFLGEMAPGHGHIEFHRGLPWSCSMSPYTFLEKGEYIFTRLAPIRSIRFFRDPEGAAFPAKEIAASPLLARIDELDFRGALGLNDLEVIAASDQLKRVIAMDIRETPVTSATWEAFASNPLTRRCFWIRSDYEVPSDVGPIAECSARFDIYPYRHFEMSEEGRALERAHGYLPWLHDDNVCDWPDAHYWLEHKVLPLFVPGSAHDAPTVYGSGLKDPVKREPRARFDKRDFDSVH